MVKFNPDAGEVPGDGVGGSGVISACVAAGRALYVLSLVPGGEAGLLQPALATKASTARVGRTSNFTPRPYGTRTLLHEVMVGRRTGANVDIHPADSRGLIEKLPYKFGPETWGPLAFLITEIAALKVFTGRCLEARCCCWSG